MEKTENNIILPQSSVEQASSPSLSTNQNGLDHVFVIKKAEKLSAAVYAITGFFESDEPLKWKLRKLATELLSATQLLKDTSGDIERGVVLSRKTIEEIKSLFQMARMAGVVSEGNHTIIDREFTSLLEAVSLPNNLFNNDKSGGLNTAFFSVPKALSVSEAKPAEAIATAPVETQVVREESTSKEEGVKDILSVRDVPEIPVAPKSAVAEFSFHQKTTPASAPVKDQKIDEGILAHMGRHSFESREPKQTKSFKEFGAVAVKKNSRQSVIINLLKRKKEIMIKDVSPLIEGVSEKTIQRELLSMVADGILKKEGEKRWSKYSLA